jgi:DnaK suppressor protein
MALSQKKLEFYRKKLLEHREKILSSGVMNNHEDLHIASEDLSDEADLATSTISQQVSLSIREREIAKLRRIDNALARVEEGTYGHCIESGELIDEKRLENQPWTEFCLEVAEEREREENQRFSRKAL